MKAQLNFRFDQFSEHLTETVFNLFSSKRLCDVRLIGEDGVPVMGHRVILAAFSRALNNVIEKNSAPTLDIRIQGMNYHDIERIIQFIYLGETSVAHAEIDKFLRSAKFLGVSQLSDQCKVDNVELSREFKIDDNLMIEETILEEGHGMSECYNEANDGVNEVTEEENLEEQGMRIGVDYEEVNLKEEINDNRMNDDTPITENNFDEKDEPYINSNTQIIDISDDFIIGEPALNFNIFSSVLYTHNFYRKVPGENGSFRALCLMCWKKDKTQKLYRMPSGNVRGIQNHMASKHAEFVDEYVKLRQMVETLRNQSRESQVQFKQQRESKQTSIRLVRKQRMEQEIQYIKMAKLKNKELELDFKTKYKELRVAKQKQFHEAQAKIKHFSLDIVQLANQKTAPQGDDDIEMAERVLQEEFTIGELSDDPKFNVFSSVFFSHNFYRKCDNGSRVLCLMCLKSEQNKKVFLKLGDHGNQRGIMGHMQSKHPEHEKIFHLQNEIIKGLRNDKREGRLYTPFISKAIVC